MVEDDDPFGSRGLHRIQLTDKSTFDQFFSACQTRLSDYTFANTFIWRDSIHLRWRILRDSLCVFANGDGGLTMLFPPLGGGDLTAALRDALEICDDYNAAEHFAGGTRVEYVSRELLDKLHLDCTTEPMSGDYVYETRRMIDLDGGDLASKRQARNRFARRYAARTEPLTPRHVRPCLDLLATWQEQTMENAAARSNVQIKRSKEVAAAADALYNADALGLRGMVLYADNRLVGFTLGEMLDAQTCSIVIEKTDRQFVGSAQYIFSEFCRQYWPHTRWCNVGDDWEVPSLAWTKQSYRPAFRIDKCILRPVRAARIALPAEWPTPAATRFAPADQLAAEPYNSEIATPRDLDELQALELKCFSQPVALSRRQMRYLLRRPTASFHVLRKDGHVIAAALLLRRRTKNGVNGRLYSLAVDGQFRGKGFGRTLLANCLSVLEREGIARVGLEVDVENQPAISLYESAGFVKVRRLSDYYAPGKDAWKMRRTLVREKSQFLCPLK